MSDSRASGILRPIASDNLNDVALDIVLQNWVRDVTGLPGNMLRIRFQPAPPAMPDQAADWGIVGFNKWLPLGGVETETDDSEIGVTTTRRHEQTTAQVTFAGPNCGSYAGLLRDGAVLRQNRASLAAAHLQLVDVGNIVLGPDLVNEVWVRRADMDLTFRRQITRTYPIRRIDSIDAPQLRDDQN